SPLFTITNYHYQLKISCCDNNLNTYLFCKRSIDPNVTNPQQLAAGVIPGSAVKTLDAQRDGIIQITEILQEYPNLDSLHLVSHGSPGSIHLGNSKLNLDTLPLYAAEIKNWFSPFRPYSHQSHQSLEYLHELHLSPPTPNFGGENSLKSSRIGDKTVQKYHDQVQNKESCPANFGSKSSKSPRIGGFRGHNFIAKPKILLYGCNVAQGEKGKQFLNKLHQLTQAQIQASSTKIGNAELGGNWQLDIAVGVDSEADNTEIVFNQATQQAYSEIFVAPVANDDPVPYPAAIELSELDGSNGFVLNGSNELLSFSGRSVSNAGDINEDGIADIIIGARRTGYLVFGGSSVGSSGTIELTELNGSDGFIINVNGSVNADSIKVSNAGDINGDGIADLIIGENSFNINQRGRSYVVFGGSGVGSSGTLALGALDGSNGFALNGIDDVDNSGVSVSNAGDVNGDGIADLIIGAFYADPNGSYSGESYVVFGGSNVGTSGIIQLSDLDGSNGFVLNGIDEDDRSGNSVSNAGDVNGDGIADLIIGANEAAITRTEPGESYVVFGGSNVGTSGTFELSSLDGSNGFVLNGIDVGDFSGDSVSNAGDINGDGIADLIIGASRADPNGNRSGESYVVFGGSNVGTSGTFELSSLDGSNGFVLNGIDEDDRLGYSVSNAGDVNGDGIADLIIGASRAGGIISGESYVVFGGSDVGSSGTIELSALNGSNGFVLNGIDGGDRSGVSVSNAGDVNGDGTTDLIIGAYYAGNLQQGESYVVFGRDFNTDQDTSFTTSSVLFNDTDADGDPLSVTAIDTTVTLGLVTSNGDGTFDYDPNGQFDFLKPGETATDIFTYTVSDGGDTDTATVTITITGVNNAPIANDDPIPYPPAIELSALDGNSGFVLKGIDSEDRSGNSLSNAGDVNGDGIADLIIGAYGANSDAGESYVIFGSNNPSSAIELSALDGSNGFVLNGIDAIDFSGRSVSSAGDVNGDGLADLIIGAPGANSDAGESYVVFGSSNPSSAIELSALDGNNGFVLKGITADDNSGTTVSNAGDVNGDGLAD
ncbi:VCBS repeat-containing protein, partial [Xenococcus sp. PCC 7305]|uniref:DUF4347 domain-containing protein n=1 Tax=Xenococcus sp. PCC 7305 TaxID=102125 RepID=UPI0002AC0AC3